MGIKYDPPLYPSYFNIYGGEIAEIRQRSPNVLKGARERGDFGQLPNLQILVSYMVNLMEEKINVDFSHFRNFIYRFANSEKHI